MSNAREGKKVINDEDCGLWNANVGLWIMDVEL